ncbi:MAG: hypothetical protein WC928_03035 [Patescibacteria group bacterium]|jgi:hypothetical protein
MKKIIKLNNKKIITLIISLVVLTYISFEIYCFFNKNNEIIYYNQVLNSMLDNEKNGFYKSAYDGQTVKWQAKISAYYSQITGIKFCVIDKEHQTINVNNPCDWFWAFSDELMDSDDTKNNPDWDGLWVNYILNYYEVPFNKNTNFYNDIYTIEGVINGIDCASKDQCVPNINIINITK